MRCLEIVGKQRLMGGGNQIQHLVGSTPSQMKLQVHVQWHGQPRTVVAEQANPCPGVIHQRIATRLLTDMNGLIAAKKQALALRYLLFPGSAGAKSWDAKISDAWQSWVTPLLGQWFNRCGS